MFSNLISVILFSTLSTFKAWNTFYHNNTILIIYDVRCRAINGSIIFTILAHTQYLSLLKIFMPYLAFYSGSSNRGEQHPCWHTIFRQESLVCYTFVKLWLPGKEPTALHLPVTPGILRWKVSRKGDS